MTDSDPPALNPKAKETVEDKKVKQFRKLLDRACTLMPGTPEPQQGWVVIIPYCSALDPNRSGVHVSARLTSTVHLGLVFEGLVTQMLKTGIHPKQMADTLTKCVMAQIQEEKTQGKIEKPAVIIPGNFGKIPS